MLSSTAAAALSNDGGSAILGGSTKNDVSFAAFLRRPRPRPPVTPPPVQEQITLRKLALSAMLCT